MPTDVQACDRQVQLWSTALGTVFQTIVCHESGSITDIVWILQKNELGIVFSSADGKVHIYTRPAGKVSIIFHASFIRPYDIM